VLAAMVGPPGTTTGVTYAQGRIVGGFKPANMPQTIGRPLPPLQLLAPEGHSSDIRWNDFNYPPVLRLIHFDITELQWKLRKVVHLLNCSLLLTTFVVMNNLLDTIVLGMVLEVPPHWVMQAALHLMFFPPAALGTFYLGYCGLATREPALLRRYFPAQGALAAVSFLMALFPYRCVNGLLRLAYGPPAGTDADVLPGFWVFAILAESALWALNGTLGVLNIVRVRRASSPGGSMYASAPAQKV